MAKKEAVAIKEMLNEVRGNLSSDEAREEVGISRRNSEIGDASRMQIFSEQKIGRMQIESSTKAVVRSRVE